MSRSLFGTDGIRGEANRFLTADLAMAAGRAAVAVLPAKRPRFLTGSDPRISSPMLEAALVAGISSAGGEVIRAGVIPTPAVASLILTEGADAGAVISASHNPWQDNGIKFFGAEGFKLTDGQEAEMEKHLAHDPADFEAPGEPGRVSDYLDPVEAYVDNLLANFDFDAGGYRVLVDCANGAAFQSSPLALKRMGADVTAMFDQPDGFNINEGCGSTNLQPLREAIRRGDYDLGLAFDGDGDRVIAVSPDGSVVDGDSIMAICARYLHEEGHLTGDTVVTTVMTNLGFRLAMEELGIGVATTDVGDRYVLEEMLKGGYSLGGEQSGHIINLDAGTTGDGLATALLLLEVMTATGKPLAELAKVMVRLPQKLVNVRVKNMKGLEEAGAVRERIETEAARLGENGRILVRPSGTEPVIRVMVEAPTAALCAEICDNIAGIVRDELGES